MEESKGAKKQKFFAAANSYRGFISYFDRVFCPSDFTRLYILKGGPGTGKSSLMKRISASFYNRGCDTEEIYCSSDPGSLDGVILSNEKSKVAVIDGTSPHERDTVYPGAADELINLGVGWDTDWLRAKREDILSLGKEKTEAYKTAYSYLSSAGCANEFIKNVYSTSFSVSKAKSWAESILKEKSPITGGKESTRLISSFGRYGEYILDRDFSFNETTVTVSGDRLMCGILLHFLYQKMHGELIDLMHFPSTLDPLLTDEVYIPCEKLSVTYFDNGTVCANDFFSPSALDKEKIKKAAELHGAALEEAKRWFSIASDLHFRLEKVYGEAMNFDKINQVAEEKAKEIANILEINL